jgi:PAS domain S-box-containing protein
MSRIVRTFSHVRPNQTIHSSHKRRLKPARTFIDYYEYNRSLIESSLDLLVTIGADGKITDVNAATEQVTGCPRQELIGADFSDFFTEPEKARAGYQQVFRDGTVQNYALEIRHQDGHVTPVLYNASVFRNDRGEITGVFAAARDITVQRSVEAALQELNQKLEQKVSERTQELVRSEERFAKAFLANPTAMVITELTSGKIVDVNETYLKLFEFTREDMIGRTALELGLISAASERDKVMRILREQGKVDNYATPLRLKSGEIRYALVSQEKIELEGRTCILSSLNDISSRKEMEDALRESEQRFKAATANTPDHIMVQDSNLRYTLVVNPQLGLTEQDMLGKTDDDILSEEDAEKLTRIKRQVLETGQPVHLETTLSSTKGVKRSFEGSYVPKKDENGRIDGLIGYFSDITRRKQAEAELARLASFPEMNTNPVLEISLAGRIEYINPSARQLFPDLIAKTVDHPFFTGWAEIVGQIQHEPDLVISRDIQVEDRYFQQNIFYVKEYDRLRIYGMDISERIRAEQALIQNQALLQAVLEGAPDPIFLKDRDSRLLVANPATLAVIGKTAEYVMGKNDREFYDDPVMGAAIMENDRRVMESGQTQVVEEIINRPGGDQVYLSTKTPYRDPHGNVIGLIGIARDITDRKEREAELNRLNRTLRALSSINQAMLRAENEAGYMQEVCRIVVEDCGHTMVWIGIVEHDEGKSIRPVASAGFDDGYLETLCLTWADTERGQGPGGTAIRTGKICTCKNMLTDPKFAPWRAEAMKRGYASSIALPLFENGEVFGELTIYSRESDPFSEEEIGLLSELASDLAYGIGLLRLRQAHAQTEAALQESEEKYRRLIENIDDLVCEVDAQARYLYVNAQYTEVLGYAPDELLGHYVRELIHPDDLRFSTPTFRKMLDGRSISRNEWRFRHKNGEWRWFDCVAQTYEKSPGDAHVVVISRDTTERRRMEEALRASEERYRSLFNGMTEGFALHEIICDENGRPVDYRFLEMNPAFERLTGLKRSDLEGQLKSVTMPGDDPYWLEVYGKVALTGEPVHYENYSTALDQFYEVDAYCPAPGQFAVIFRNVTERKKAQERIFVQAQMLAAVGQGVVAVDLRGKITYWNRAAAQLYGWRSDEILGCSLAEVVFPPDQAPRGRFELIMAAMAGGENWTGEIAVKHRDGSLFTVVVTFAPIKDEYGPLTGVIGVFTDLTERLQIEEQLRQSERLYRGIGESIDYGVWVCAPDGRNIYASDSFLKMVGLTQQQCSDFGWGDVLHPEDSQRTIAAWKECVQTGGNWDIEHRFRGVDGKYHAVLARGVPVRNEKGEILSWAGINLDISRIKLAEDRLNQSLQNLEFLSESAVHLLRPMSSQEAFSYVADKIFELAGGALIVVNEYDPGSNSIIIREVRDDQDELDRLRSIAGMNLVGMTYPFLPETRQKVRQGELSRIEGGLYNLSSNKIPLKISDRIEKELNLGEVYATAFSNDEDFIGMVVVLTHGQGLPDNAAVIAGLVGQAGIALTRIRAEQERQAVLEQLEIEKERWQTTVESMLDPVMVANVEGRVTFMNSAAVRISGRSVLPMMGFNEYPSYFQLARPNGTLYQPDELPLQRSALLGEMQQNVEVMQRDLLGGEHNVLWNAAPLHNPNGSLAGAVAVGRDVTPQRKAEAELRASEERFRSLVEFAPEAILAHRQGKWIYANPYSLELLGAASVEDIVGHPMMDFYAPDYRAVLRQRIMKVLADGQPSPLQEMKMVRCNGSTVDVETRGAMTVFDGQPSVIVIAKDVSARKITEEALKQSEQRYRTLFETMAQGVVYLDPEGKIISANPAAQHILHLSIDELQGRISIDTIWQSIHEDGSLLQADEHPVAVALRTGKPVQNVVIGNSNPSAGEIIWIKMDAVPQFRPGEDQPYQVYVVIDEITARKTAEAERDRALDEAQRRAAELDAVFDSIADGVMLIGSSGEIQRLNPAAQRIFNFSPDQFKLSLEQRAGLARPFSADGRPIGRDEEYPVSRALRGETVRNMSFSIPSPNSDRRIWLSMSAAPLKDEKNTGAVLSFTDISDRMEMEKELRQARDELEARVQERTAELTAILTALRESEERFRQLAENIREVFVLFTPGELRPFYVSPAYTELIGISPDTMYEDPFSFLNTIYAEDRPEMGTFMSMINEGKFDQQYRIVRQDGSLRWIRARGFPVCNKQGELYRVAAIIEDVTNEVEAYQVLEQRVEERTRELATLLSYSEKLASTLELKPLMQIMLDQLCSVIDFDGAAVLLIEGDDLVTVEYQGPAPEEDVLSIRFSASISPGISRVIETRAPVMVSDLQGDGLEAIQFRQANSPMNTFLLGQARSWLGVPLIVKNNLVGILRLSHSQPERFTQRQVKLVTAIANQAAMAIENAQLYEKSRQLAALGERQRLARELHDSVSQALYGISLGTHTAIALTRRDPEKLDDVLQYVLSLAEAGLTEMRALIFELRPESLETEGLVGALNRQAAALQARRGVSVKANLCDEIETSVEVKEALYRIAQEAMQNAIKHANPSEICLELSCSEHFIEMLIMDNGKGFDPGQAFPGHLGLHSMRERAARLGGNLEINSAPGQGTRVRVKLPL